MIVQRLERPLSNVLSLQDLALHTRTDGMDEVLPELQRFALAAVCEAEDLAQIALLSQAVRVTLDAWPRGNCLRLPIGPLLDWDSVSVSAGGVDFEDFTTTTGMRPELRLVGARPLGQVVIEYFAGFSEEGENIPEDLRLAIMDQAAAYFDARGPGNPKAQALSPHFARIIGRYRGVRV